LSLGSLFEWGQATKEGRKEVRTAGPKCERKRFNSAWERGKKTRNSEPWVETLVWKRSYFLHAARKERKSVKIRTKMRGEKDNWEGHELGSDPLRKKDAKSPDGGEGGERVSCGKKKGKTVEKSKTSPSVLEENFSVASGGEEKEETENGGYQNQQKSLKKRP